jgi:hypothetical protein
MASADCIAVENIQYRVLVVPIPTRGAAEKAKNSLGSDISYIDIAADDAAELLKPIIRTCKLVSHGLPEGDIVGD